MIHLTKDEIDLWAYVEICSNPAHVLPRVQTKTR